MPLFGACGTASTGDGGGASGIAGDGGGGLVLQQEFFLGKTLLISSRL